jgi:mRNA-degrading endonuclease toxin of MazEF toxin-antitoxin module
MILSMPLRIGFDMDVVLADLSSAFRKHKYKKRPEAIVRPRPANFELLSYFIIQRSAVCIS